MTVVNKMHPTYNIYTAIIIIIDKSDAIIFKQLPQLVAALMQAFLKPKLCYSWTTVTYMGFLNSRLTLYGQ